MGIFSNIDLENKARAAEDAAEHEKDRQTHEEAEVKRKGYGCDVPDDLCYAWAVEYFHDMEAPEDKREDEKEFIPKPYIPSTPRKTKSKPKAEPAKPKAEKPAPPPKTKPADAQLSMFDPGVA